MLSFVYKAKDASAKSITGRISANNQDEALDELNRQGLVPVSIEEEAAAGVLVKNIRERRVRHKELLLFTKQLAGLIRSGVVLLKALEVIAAQTTNIYFAKMINDIAMGVKTGRSFSACLSDYPTVFSSLYVSMIKAGEEMGHLREVLSDIADFLKRQDEMALKVRSALVYPCVMLVVGMVTVFVILTFVLPKIAVIFTGTGEQMPWPTRVVMAASHYLRIFSIPIIAVAAGGFVLFNRWRKSPGGKITLGFFGLGIPFIKDLLLKTDMARFARTLYLLLDSSLPLTRSIEVATATINNPQLRADVYLCAQGLTAGENLGACLKRSVFMPVIFVQMLSIAEESGELNDALKDIADSCETEVNESLKTMASLIEPLMILAVGLIVGFIVFAMLMPIFSMDVLAR